MGDMADWHLEQADWEGDDGWEDEEERGQRPMADDSEVSVSVRVNHDSANAYNCPRLEIRRIDDEEIEIVTTCPDRTLRVSADGLIRAIRFLTEDY